MDFFSSMRISATGMTAQQTRMNTISSNLANAETTESPEGGPYKRRDPIFTAQATARRSARFSPARWTSTRRVCRSSGAGRSEAPAWSTTPAPARQRRRLRGDAQREPGRGDGQHDLGQPFV